MRGFFPKDSVLRIASFIIAIILWFYVILVVDPSVDIVVKDIPLRYSNQDVLGEKGLSVVIDPDATVELKIRGSRKKIANIENKNIYATVDLANMNSVGTFNLPISISIPYEYEEIVSKKPNNATVVIDEISTAERKVKIKTVGSVANGYMAGTPVHSVEKVTLKGAKSMVEQIYGVEAVLDFDSRTGEINDREKLYFTDSNGKRIDADDVVYQAVSIDVDTVEINCPVMKLKTVPVTVDAAGLGEDFKLSLQPSNVTIYAENEILAEVTEIAAEIVDVKKLTEEGVLKVELQIPEGVSMRDGIKEVTVKVEKKD